jgi:hypothetical protein
VFSSLLPIKEIKFELFQRNQLGNEIPIQTIETTFSMRGVKVGKEL